VSAFADAHRSLLNLRTAYAEWGKLDPSENADSPLAADVFEAGDEALYEGEWSAFMAAIKAPTSRAEDIAQKVMMINERELWDFTYWPEAVTAIISDLGRIGPQEATS
jgi:hypothetical protein